MPVIFDRFICALLGFRAREFSAKYGKTLGHFPLNAPVTSNMSCLFGISKQQEMKTRFNNLNMSWVSGNIQTPLTKLSYL